MQEEAGSVTDGATGGEGELPGKKKVRGVPTVEAVVARESAAAGGDDAQDAEPAAGESVQQEAGTTHAAPEPQDAVPAPQDAVAEDTGAAGDSPSPDAEDEMKKQEEDNNFKLFDEDADAEEQAALDARRADMNLEGETALLETVLFLESEPQSVEVLAKITQLSEDVVVECLERLKEKYLSPDSGIEVSQIIGGWMLTPKKECFDLVKERYGKKNEGRLSKAAIETLSIIAYSQPITRAEIENYRHVNADNMMRILLDRKFIKEVGKKDVPGKPVLYGTTKEFLEFFHLQSIADLPQLDEKESERFELAR